jgi:hypothetical protein
VGIAQVADQLRQAKTRSGKASGPFRPERTVVLPQARIAELRIAVADEVVCATTPSPFFAVGNSYWDFTQTTDEEVRDLLRAAPVRLGP